MHGLVRSRIVENCPSIHPICNCALRESDFREPSAFLEGFSVVVGTNY